MVYRSISTVKADAARRSYDAFGEDITWAVVDSGIDGRHLHFRTHDNLGGDVAELHRDFTGTDEQTPGHALKDTFGHGSHVAGIVAGGLPAVLPKGRKLNVATQIRDALSRGRNVLEVSSDAVEPGEISGVAPRCKLVSLRVIDGDGRSQVGAILRALQYVNELNGGGKRLRVHGVNLSLAYQFDQEWYACGQSPLCVEVDRLVRSGVVVVAAAGNSGFGPVTAMAGSMNTGLSITINDPGNAERAITVGSTHRDMPHTYGVSYFSSKGPTADGRPKPDLVAPGERIASCAAGRPLAQVYGTARPPAGHVTYIPNSGTAMACAHVSGAVAAFLSVHREFLGRPDDIKRIFLENATSLGRTAEFQGHGLVDLMRALQAV
ncbi:MAG TPA: S8 family peptidase [Actinomycetes bacterium]|nr:S8 family peptidase [Actinomycetes bacterium]